MYVIGTAGHVDHGKSTLVRLLTGIDPDRLKEEKQRQLTIDLGFAWMELPAIGEVGVVDVPGHRDFIENMLAGVGSIDACLFVVAADEGVMPQTREHLAIIDLLGVKDGVIALTKIDLVEDPEWLELVEDEIRRVLAGTSLAQAPLVRISGKSEAGLEDLRAALVDTLRRAGAPSDLGRARLGVDRVFSVAGFGTVVTGTLVDGELQIGDEVELMPAGTAARVRGLQAHKHDRQSIGPGSRAAVNLAGVDVDEIERGDVVTRPGAYRATDMIDVHVRLIEHEEAELHHNQELKLFLGAAQRMCRLRLLGGAESLRAGEQGWLQLLLEQPVIGQRGDRYILRRPSPPLTIAGGQIVEAHPSQRHRLQDMEAVDRLRELHQGDPSDVLLQLLRRNGLMLGDDLVRRAGLEATSADRGIEHLVNAGRVRSLRDGLGDVWLASNETLTELGERARQDLRSYHGEYPLRAGMPQEELRSRLSLRERQFEAALGYLVEDSDLVQGQDTVALSTFTVEPSPEQARAVEAMLERFKEAPYSPPSVSEARSELGEPLYEYLRRQGELVQVADDVVFSQKAYGEMVQSLKKLIERTGPVTVAQVRDHFDSSRKYVLGLLEHLDQQGVTVREGDLRRLRGT